MDYFATIQKTMNLAIREAEKISAKAAKERNAAIDDTNRADKLLRDVEWAAQKKAQAWVDKNRKKLRLEAREMLLTTLARHLHNSGKTVGNIAGLLDLPEPDIEKWIAHG